MAQLSPNDISQLARLARLDLTDEERERYSHQLTSVVGYVEQLTSVTLPDDLPAVGSSGPVNVLAEDVPRTAGDPLDVSRENLLAGAPSAKDGYIQVRAVMAGEAESA